MPGYMGPYTSNRGMTLYPEQNYANNVAYYTPQPQQVGGGRQVNSDGSRPGAASSGGMDWGSMFAGLMNPAGQQSQTQTIDPRNLSGRDRQAYNLAMAQGNSPFRNRFGGGTRYNPADYGGQGSGSPPPATTNPQTQIGGGGAGGNVTQVNSGITNGQLSDASIQAGLQRLLAGGQRAFQMPSNMSNSLGANGITGGLFGDLMKANTMRAANDYSRAAAQQQADMQNAFEVARAGGNIQQAQLASDLNRENVTNSVIQRNTLLDLLGQLMRGFGSV